VWGKLNRKEAIALLSELGANQLVNPNFVLIEERKPSVYQLKIKGIIAFRKLDYISRIGFQ
jgi:hypothetical protein